MHSGRGAIFVFGRPARRVAQGPWPGASSTAYEASCETKERKSAGTLVYTLWSRPPRGASRRSTCSEWRPLCADHSGSHRGQHVLYMAVSSAPKPLAHESSSCLTRSTDDKISINITHYVRIIRRDDPAQYDVYRQAFLLNYYCGPIFPSPVHFIFFSHLVHLYWS